MVLSNFPRRARILPAVLLALVAILVPAATAGATCYSSTPSSSLFVDSPFDGEAGSAPEIADVTASVDGTCGVAVNPGVAEPLVDGDAVFVYIDTDGNAATGDPDFEGADVAVGSLGAAGPDPAPLMGTWDPSIDDYSFDNAPSLTPLGIGGFSTTIDQLGFTPPLTGARIRVGTVWFDGVDGYSDFAPDAATAPFPLAVAFSATPPPPPPPAPVVTVVVPPTPPPAPVAPAQVVAPAKPCKVPALKRLRTAAAKAAIRRAGCKVGTTKRAYSASIALGRVVTSHPKAGTKSTAPVDLVVSRGRKPKKHHKAHRASATDVRSLLEAAARQLDARG